MNVLIAFDKFKGSISAQEACYCLANALHSNQINVSSHPLADGGESSLEILANYLPIEYIPMTTLDALHRPIEAKYGKINKEAFIETSAACGLQLIEPMLRNPMLSSTYGVGLLIKDALQRGCNKIHLFLGGSGTNDGGIGMACALGYQFLDKHQNPVKPNGENMIHIKTIIQPTDISSLKKVEFLVWSDVSVPLTGTNGAALMFAKQKGASDSDIHLLENGMNQLINVWEKSGMISNPNSLSHGGAAGGLAAGASIFLNASLGSGISFLMENTGIIQKLNLADVVITGEGKIDSQSLEGKVISGISHQCRKLSKKLILVGGEITLTKNKLQEMGVWKTYALMDYAKNTGDAMMNPQEYLTIIGSKIKSTLGM